MIREYSGDEHGQNPRHVSNILSEVFVRIDFGMAANSPDPQAREEALGRLRAAGYPEPFIQERIACWKTARRLQAIQLLSRE